MLVASPNADLNGSELCDGRPRTTAFLFVTAVVLTGVGLSRTRVDAHWLDELPQDDPVVEDLFGEPEATDA